MEFVKTILVLVRKKTLFKGVFQEIFYFLKSISLRRRLLSYMQKLIVHHILLEYLRLVIIQMVLNTLDS